MSWSEDEILPFESEALASLGITERPGSSLKPVAPYWDAPEWYRESLAEEERRLIMENAPRQTRHFLGSDGRLWEDLLIVTEIRFSSGEKAASHIAVPNSTKHCTCSNPQAIKDELAARYQRAMEEWRHEQQGARQNAHHIHTQ